MVEDWGEIDAVLLIQEGDIAIQRFPHVAPALDGILTLIIPGAE